MSPPRKPRARSTAPDPDRWPECTRCGQCYQLAARWPEGPICTYCYNAARRREGVCADCGHTGMVPGLNTAGEPACLRCSGVPLMLTCAGCGQEAWLAKGATCWRCLLRDMVHDHLAGPDGQISPALQPMAEALCSMPRANSGVTWMRANPQVGQLLRGLGTGSIELSHEALDALPAGRTVEYLRALLVTHHALPPRDRRLATFQRWLDDTLARVDHPEHKQLLDRFARWHHLRDLRRQSEHGPVEAGPVLRAKQSITVTIEFLGWLDRRGITLAELSQHEIDSWHAGGPGTREHVQRFLYWCRAQRLTGKLELPRRDKDNPRLIGEHARLEIIRSLLLHDELALPYRIAGCLITLFGQPAGKVVALTLADLAESDASSPELRLRLGKQWVPVPEQLAALIRLHLEHRANTNTAANAQSRWLFPGQVPGEHLSRTTLLAALRGAGIPVRAARNTTWQQLVREAPPQVLADALGISPATAMKHAQRAGSDWARYVSTTLHQR
ncbi:hypothetical protein ACL02T_10155 [Pseudonocardia sp. RS010]|uniref:hypothetical protein n=1 Tax=Pseudonocardia sp. RS010 TaxID=3385979 RepID=UPI0039A14141